MTYKDLYVFIPTRSIAYRQASNTKRLRKPSVLLLDDHIVSVYSGKYLTAIYTTRGAYFIHHSRILKRGLNRNNGRNELGAKHYGKAAKRKKQSKEKREKDIESQLDQTSNDHHRVWGR